ncbi:MAG: hypothetical protein V7642_5557 [Burkholderiales bacterium]|jgi:hypothetical protein
MYLKPHAAALHAQRTETYAFRHAVAMELIVIREKQNAHCMLHTL